jgi:hypothetical protein
MRLAIALLFSTLIIPAAAKRSIDVAQAYENADIVFTGVVESINVVGFPESIETTAIFEVLRPIKGNLVSNRKLTVNLTIDGHCDRFQVRHSYLVYGRVVGAELSADPCGDSKLISQAERDLRYIHSINPLVSEQCSEKRLSQLAGHSSIVAIAEVIGTEDSLGTTTSLFRPWCGISLTTEDAYYHVREVLKGHIADSKIVVEYPICWDTITVDGYHSTLSPELFKEGNALLLFLNKGSHKEGRIGSPSFPSLYMNMDENCGAINADDKASIGVADSIRAMPEVYKDRSDEER